MDIALKRDEFAPRDVKHCDMDVSLLTITYTIQNLQEKIRPFPAHRTALPLSGVQRHCTGSSSPSRTPHPVRLRQLMSYCLTA